MRVLVFDNEAAVSQALATLLERSGAEVLWLTDPFVLAAFLDSHSFDIVIGDELALMLVIERSPRSRRFLLTRSRADWTDAQLEALGAELVIEKPWDEDQLLRDLELLK